ncbi:histidine phosphatase family protein [Hydrogenophaga crassostreae]|uniref:Histidine phosphatase family protein n=1 Tax=Hydrogenophaga crassostreae TaxID=1763535 RepID=A0A1D8NXK2_9BURK|nr:histidine phosphatase family protein [Hydrogenophaga crassostreae]AOW13826.1 histidine phosphatase family protein [Hydrogenophaga crassostreae]
MTISFMRHGKPALVECGWVTPAQMARWIERYDLSEVGPQDIPTSSYLRTQSADVVATSTAARAMSSARLLGRTPDVLDPVFGEAELPFALINFPRLPPSIWAAVFRIAWFFGYARSAESIRNTKARAKAAAIQLVALAEEGSVLLIGHGIMNRLIAKELSAMGWRGKVPQRAHWGVSTYVETTPPGA